MSLLQLLTVMNVNIYTFVHNKQDYYVTWEEEDKVLRLEFFDSSSNLLGIRTITLLDTINQEQLDSIVYDYWRSFVKNELKVDDK